jgi:hypothetical protein
MLEKTERDININCVLASTSRNAAELHTHTHTHINKTMFLIAAFKFAGYKITYNTFVVC